MTDKLSVEEDFYKRFGKSIEITCPKTGRGLGKYMRSWTRHTDIARVGEWWGAKLKTLLAQKEAEKEEAVRAERYLMSEVEGKRKPFLHPECRDGKTEICNNCCGRLIYNQAIDDIIKSLSK